MSKGENKRALTELRPAIRANCTPADSGLQKNIFIEGHNILLPGLVINVVPGERIDDKLFSSPGCARQTRRIVERPGVSRLLMCNEGVCLLQAKFVRSGSLFDKEKLQARTQLDISGLIAGEDEVAIIFDEGDTYCNMECGGICKDT